MSQNLDGTIDEFFLSRYKENKRQLSICYNKLIVLNWVYSSRVRCYERNYEKYSEEELSIIENSIGWLDDELYYYQTYAREYQWDFEDLLDSI